MPCNTPHIIVIPLYVCLGQKRDSWMAVDSLTGSKLHSFSNEGISSTCSLSDSHGSVIHIGRTGK